MIDIGNPGWCAGEDIRFVRWFVLDGAAPGGEGDLQTVSAGAYSGEESEEAKTLYEVLF